MAEFKSNGLIHLTEIISGWNGISVGTHHALLFTYLKETEGEGGREVKTSGSLGESVVLDGVWLRQTHEGVFS